MTPQLDESFALCGVRSDELKDSTLVAPWNDSGFQPADGRDSELHLLGLSSQSGASIVTPRGCFIVPKLRPFVLVHLREGGRGFVLPSTALEGRPRLMRATLGPIADVPLARRCGLVETADASAWLSLTTSEGRPLLAEDLTFETLDAASGESISKNTNASTSTAKRVSPLGCVARSEFSATAPRLVTQKSTRLSAYLGLQESGTESLRVESALGADFFRRCRINPDDNIRALLSKTLNGSVDKKNRLELRSVEGAAPADIAAANFSVCTTAGSSEGCPQSAWESVVRTAGTHGLMRVGACILAPPGDGRALSSLRVSMQGGRAFFAFLEKAPAQATSIAPVRVMEIPSAARFREAVRFEIARCLVDPAGRVRNVHEKQPFDARLAGGEVAGIAGSFVPSKLIWTAHATNGTTRQIAFPLTEPFGALPFESIGFPFDTTSSSEWVDARLEVRFPSGETVVLEEAGGCRLSPWRASVAKVDVAERDLGFIARGNARTLEELGIDRSTPGLNDERVRYAYAFGPTAPDSGERWFADGASCLAGKGWKEVRDGVVSFLTPGRFGLSIRACNPAGGSAAPWTFRTTVSSTVPNFELAWIDPLQLAPIPTIGSFRAPVPFEVRDLRDDVLSWNDLAANASCQVFIVDGSPLTKTSLSCSLEPDSRLRVLKGRVNFATHSIFDVDDDVDAGFQSWAGRRLRVVVRVGSDEADRRERFLEAEIPRYVLQGYVPVVDILPEAAMRMDICGTARTENGTQYALMADGNILRHSHDSNYWGAFATMSSQSTAFVEGAARSWQRCVPFDIVTWGVDTLLVTPVRQEIERYSSVTRYSRIPELCSLGKCEPFFTRRVDDESLRVLARSDDAIAGLFTDPSGKTPPRLMARIRGQDEFEIPLSDSERREADHKAELRFLPDGSLLVGMNGQFVTHNVSDKTRHTLPEDLTQSFIDGGWNICLTLGMGDHACVRTTGPWKGISILHDSKVVQFEVPDFELARHDNTELLGVHVMPEAYFIAYAVNNDTIIARFDMAGNLIWKRNIFVWREGRNYDPRKYPAVFSVIDGLVTFINSRCQSFAFDENGVERNLTALFGITPGLAIECAVPALKQGQIVYHSARYGMLQSDKSPAATWNEFSTSYVSAINSADSTVLSRARVEINQSGEDGRVTLHSYDERQTTFTLPVECPQFEYTHTFL